MRFNKTKILGHVNNAFAIYGWKDSGNIILRVAEMLAKGSNPREVVNIIPPRFTLANNIKKSDIIPVLERVMKEKDIIEMEDDPTVHLLFVYAGPLDENPLRLGAEEKQIKESLRAITNRTSIHIDTIPAVELKDFSNAFNRHRPNVLHISSHGNQGFIVLEDENGEAAAVDEDTLNTLVGLAGTNLKMVVLNACNSSKLAKALTKTVDVVIGMSASIGDNAARTFAVQLYSSIGEGVSVGLAFEQAKFAIKASGINESSTPVIYSRKGINIKTNYL